MLTFVAEYWSKIPAFLRRRLWAWIVWLDITVNVFVLQGNPHETISQHAAWSRDHWWGRALCWLLDKIVPGHCDRCIAGVNRAGNKEG